MIILCIDVGNTHFHSGLVFDGDVLETHRWPTHELGIRAPMLLSRNDFEGVAYCSVVPEATWQLEAALHATDAPKPMRLDHLHCPGLGIGYRKPAEVGTDRLANSIGVQVTCGAPAVVIDTGTALTFDLVSAKDGFIGGIIAPGMAMMTRYLHEKTALLPQLELADLVTPAEIGHSTRDAMKIGCTVGYAGMIKALLQRSREEFARRAEPEPTVVATGGGTEAWQRHLDEEVPYIPHLTMIGLAEAWRRTHASGD